MSVKGTTATVQIIDWNQRRADLKRQTEMNLDKITPVASGLVTQASQSCIGQTGEKIKPIAQDRITERCPTAAPILNPLANTVIDASIKSSKDAAPQVVNACMTKTCDNTKRCASDCIDRSVNNNGSLLSRLVTWILG